MSIVRPVSPLTPSTPGGSPIFQGMPLLIAAALRSFCTGLTGVLLGLHLARLGFPPAKIGLVVAMGLAGNAVATAVVSAVGGKVPLRTLLTAAAALNALGLAAVAAVNTAGLLAAAVFLGMVNGMGRDRGPAQTLEQAVLTTLAGKSGGTRSMVHYTAAQDILGGLGSLTAGIPDYWGGDPRPATRAVLAAAALISLIPILLYRRVPASATAAAGVTDRPSPEVRRRVRNLAGLFALDSLGGGFLAGSILAWWFFARFGLTGNVTGPLFLAARMLNAGSYFAAEWLAARIGLIRTMVFTHLPSSGLLLILPLTSSPFVAITAFLLREALVQMDVPTRTAYVAAVTPPEHRVYALGITGLVRNIGWATGPALAGWTAGLWLGAPIIAGAGLKMTYDVALYRSFAATGEG